MAFMLEDRDPSITSESAPFIEPVEYDSDVELFQVPLKRNRLPLVVPGQDIVSKAALQYALAVSTRAISEDSLSTYSQPVFSRDTSPRRASSSPPSSVASADIKDREKQDPTADHHQSKVREAKQLQIRKGKAKTVLTKRPRRLVLPLQPNTYHTGHHEEDWAYIYHWMDQCHHNTSNSETEADNIGAIAGPQFLHPFLGPCLFSPNTQPPPNTSVTNAHPTQQPNIHQPIQPTPINPFIQLQETQPLQNDNSSEPPSDPPSRKSSKNTTPDSAYDRAREVEIYLSESAHYTHQTPVNGKQHWVIDCDLTEVSHFRLAELAKRSAEGFDIGVMHTGAGVSAEMGASGEEMEKVQTAAELANLYRVLAVVHIVYGEEMRRERKWIDRERVERKGRMGSKIGSVKGRRMVRRVLGGGD